MPLTLTAPKSTGGTKEESEVVAGVVDRTTAVALTRLWRGWGAAGVSGGGVCSEEKGATLGSVFRAPRLPKIGLKVGVKSPGGEQAETVAETLACTESPVSALGGSSKMGCGVGSAGSAPGGADTGRRGAPPLIPEDTLCTVSGAGVTAGGSRGVGVPPA